MKVMIDPGHGGRETGAVHNGILEKDLNLEVATVLKNLLQNQGFEVAMTRHQDIDVSLEARVYQANSWQANIFVSIHHNGEASGTASGYEVYHHTGSVQGTKLANAVAKQFDTFNHKRYVGGGMWAGHKQGEYFVLRHTHMPAILGEPYFISTPEDFAKYNPYRQANAYFLGICEYFGVVPKKEEPKKEEEHWKMEGINVLAGLGLLNTPEDWKKKIEEPMPVWATMLILSRIAQRVERK